MFIWRNFMVSFTLTSMIKFAGFTKLAIVPSTLLMLGINDVLLRSALLVFEIIELATLFHFSLVLRSSTFFSMSMVLFSIHHLHLLSP